MFTLSIAPTHHPECCLSISEALFACIARCLAQITESAIEKTTILSVGCGTGFLEAHLTDYLQEHGFRATKVAAVEVTSGDVKYLASELVSYVSSTRSISQCAGSAEILLFIYPHDGDLIRQYLTRFGSNIRMLLWLGPRADWMVQNQILHDIPGFQGPWALEDAGLAVYEVGFVFQNRTNPQVERDAHNITSEEGLSLDIDSI